PGGARPPHAAPQRPRHSATAAGAAAEVEGGDGDRQRGRSPGSRSCRARRRRDVLLVQAGRAGRADPGRGSPAASGCGERRRRSDMTKGSILIVDDEPGLVELLKWELTSLGHAVLGVGSGAEAVCALQKTEFDVVISDVRMPGM